MDNRIFKVISDNIECAFCKEPICAMRYYPDHVRIINGHRYGCKKNYEKKFREITKEQENQKKKNK